MTSDSKKRPAGVVAVGQPQEGQINLLPKHVHLISLVDQVNAAEICPLRSVDVENLEVGVGRAEQFRGTLAGKPERLLVGD
jgi:hypothetical protein